MLGIMKSRMKLLMATGELDPSDPLVHAGVLSEA
jgi:hypothetical protein